MTMTAILLALAAVAALAGLAIAVAVVRRAGGWRLRRRIVVE